MSKHYREYADYLEDIYAGVSEAEYLEERAIARAEGIRIAKAVIAAEKAKAAKAAADAADAALFAKQNPTLF